MTDDIQRISGDRAPDALSEGEALAASASTTLVAPAGYKKLYDPDHEHLYYGPHGQHDSPPNVVGGNIEIGVIEPHVAIVPADHPLIEQFLRDHPHAIAVQPGEQPGKGHIYVCDVDDKEFSTKEALQAHRRGAHHGTASTSAAPRVRVPRRPAKAKARRGPTAAAR